MRLTAVLLSSVRAAFVAVLGFTSISVASVGAHAETLSFFDTGVASNGSQLQAGVADSHYSLIYASDGGTYTAVATTPNGAWTTAPDAGWISPGASGNQNWNAAYYVYETTLDVTGYDPSTVVLSGMVAADDSVSIYLNRGGNAVFSSTGFSTLTPFQISSGFQSGVNQIDFVVTNYYGPTGLLVSDATAVTPEPGSFYLLGTGLLGSVGAMARKFRS